MMKKMTIIRCAGAALALLACLDKAQAESAPQTASADAFTALCEKITRQPEAATDADAASLLEQARTQNRPLAATAAMKAYLTRHPGTKGDLLLKAAEVAQLAGDYRAAVTRYKSYLEAPAGATEAAHAAAQIDMILIDFLRQDEEAYQFMRSADEQTWQSAQTR